MRFIGEDGYYPKWAQGKGRWVVQRVFTTAEEFMAKIDYLAKPAIADEGVVWVPPRGGVNGLASIFNQSAESWRALYELQYIPFVCSMQYDRCNWKGFQPRVWLYGSSPRPMFWRVRCPKCGSIAFPDIADLDYDIIINRWKSLGRPALDNPAAAKMIVSVKPVYDFKKWIENFKPMETELAYVGQQLWPNLAHFLKDAKKAS